MFISGPFPTNLFRKSRFQRRNKISFCGLVIPHKHIKLLNEVGFSVIRPTMDKETHQSIMSLLQLIPGAQPQPQTAIHVPAHIPFMISTFLSGEDSSPLSSLKCPMSPPIFSRQANKGDALGPQKFSDTLSFGLVHQIKAEEEEDQSVMHMLLVDGWSQYLPRGS